MKPVIFRNQPAVKKLISFIEAGGPEVNEYDELTHLWDSLDPVEENANVDGETKNSIIRIFGEEHLNETIQGFGYRKPHGYAGDFEIIDFIYQQKTTSNKLFQKWDHYFHAQHASRAVRNRKKYFIDLVKRKSAAIDRPLHILNIASGPCREVAELLQEIPIGKLSIHCVEMDPGAIDYAKNLLGTYASSIKFTQKNIFRFDTEEKYDLIWSAGLFDYFEDKAFIRLLNRIYSWCASCCEIVIGNFSISNPSRCYMEKIGEWFLFHRSKQELIDLAVKAGFKSRQVKVKCEALGVNLFVHINVNEHLEKHILCRE